MKKLSTRNIYNWNSNQEFLEKVFYKKITFNIPFFKKGELVSGVLYSDVTLDFFSSEGFKIIKTSLKRETHLSNGVRHGIETIFYNDSSIKSINNFKYGILDGNQKYWYDNGNKQKEEFYLEGLLDGVRKHYFRGASGELRKKEFYLKGKKEGEHIEWHPNNQIVKSREKFSNNKKHGCQIYYYQNGNTISEEHYIHGIKNGIFKSFYSTGVLNNLTEYNKGVIVTSEDFNIEEGERIANEYKEMMRKSYSDIVKFNQIRDKLFETADIPNIINSKKSSLK